MKTTTKNLTLSAMFLAIGMVLPFFTGQIPQIGKMLLPMHIPVFLCGLICGWQYGAVVGLICRCCGRYYSVHRCCIRRRWEWLLNC